MDSKHQSQGQSSKRDAEGQFKKTGASSSQKQGRDNASKSKTNRSDDR